MSVYDRAPNAKKDAFWTLVYSTELKGQLRFYQNREEEQKRKRSLTSQVSNSRRTSMVGVTDEMMLNRLKNYYFPPLRKPKAKEPPYQDKPMCENTCKRIMYPVSSETKKLLTMGPSDLKCGTGR